MTRKKTDPYFYQKVGIYRMIHRFNGRVLLADDVGLGKTIQALYAAMPFRRKRPIVIVCPAAVKYSWEAEVKKHTYWNCWVLEGTKPPSRLPLDVPPVIILNYDILRPWLDSLLKLNANVIILDEGHYIKSPTAIRTKCVRLLCKDVRHVFILSGTPIENRPAEFFVALNILRKDIFKSFRPFGFKFCGPKFNRWGVEYKGATNLKELNKLLRKHLMIRRTKSEVLKDLPPIQRVMVPLKIDMKPYEEAQKNFINWMIKTNPKAIRKLLYKKDAIHLSKISHLLTLTAELKQKGVIEWIKNFLKSTDRKLVVFGHHRKFLEVLHEEFKDNSVLVYGGIAGRKRQARIDEFVNSKKCRLFFGSITAVGTGINKLQTVCSDQVIAELHWVGVKILQAEGRLHRVGQKNAVTSYYLLAKDTIEASIAASIVKKQKNINEVMDGRDGESQEFDVLDEVIKELYKKVRI